MARSALARKAEADVDIRPPSPLPGPKPFALRLAERASSVPVRKSGIEDVFDDPTTVDTTGMNEDPHTDES